MFACVCGCYYRVSIYLVALQSVCSIRKLFHPSWNKLEGSRCKTYDQLTHQVHDEVKGDGQVSNEEGSTPSTLSISWHHHIWIAWMKIIRSLWDFFNFKILLPLHIWKERKKKKEKNMWPIFIILEQSHYTLTTGKLTTTAFSWPWYDKHEKMCMLRLIRML